MIEFTTYPHHLTGHGLGLRSEHIEEILQEKPNVDWFEVITENYMHHRGAYFETLLQIRKDYPIVTHGVSLSIGSTDPLDDKYLEQLKEYISILEPALVSDHLCWNHVHGHFTHDLLPLPMNMDVVHHIVARIQKVQDFLGRPILLENLSSYVGFEQTDMKEWDFISEIANQSGCGILLDLNNVYVNAFNYGFDGSTYIDSIPPEKVGYLHFGGHEDMGDYLFDTHGDRMKPGAWDFYKQLLERMGPKPTTFEWDTDIPPLEILMQERATAMEIEKNVLA